MHLYPQEQQDIQSIARFIFTYKKFWLLFLVVGAICGAFYAWLSPVQYTAKAIVFAVNTTDNEKSGISSPFGLEMHADQMIQVLSAQAMKDSVIQKCHWIEHFQIDTSDISYRNKLYHIFETHVTISRSRNLAIEIKSTFADKKMAAKVANTLIDNAPIVYNTILRQANYPMLDSAKKYLARTNQELSISRDKGNVSLSDTLIYKQISAAFALAQKRKNEAQERYNIIQSRAERFIMPLYVIDYASVPSVSSSPNYLKTISIGSVLFLFLGLVSLAISVLWKRIREI